MYLKWTDRSLCESGFSFARGASLFASQYDVQSAQACWLPHAPVSVYDDLIAAQLQNQVAVGSFQSYCIRAVNPIGCDNANSYTSDSACVTKQILWESALSGRVRGREATGSLPIEGVIIMWSFVDYPEVNGTAITNVDGYFADKFTGVVGLNIQVSFELIVYNPSFPPSFSLFHYCFSMCLSKLVVF
jgi:hypothetical protein